MTAKKKPNKQKRDERRSRDAEKFNEGFLMGYQMGVDAGRKELENWANRERIRWAHYGRR